MSTFMASFSLLAKYSCLFSMHWTGKKKNKDICTIPGFTADRANKTFHQLHQLLINVHLSPGRTSAGPLWPPSWCSPACHRGCSSCTSGTLTTTRKHFTDYIKIMTSSKQKKAGTFLQVGHASLRHDGDPGGNIGSFHSHSSLIQSLWQTHKYH